MAGEIVFFLVVLIVALLLGNFLLSLTKPKASKKENGFSSENADAKSNGFSQNQNSDANGQFSSLYKRVDRIENLLLQLNNSDEVLRKLAELKISQRVSELSDFRQSAKLELASLKERLDSIECKKPERTKALHEFSESDEEFDKKIHQILYHSRK